MLGGIVRFRQVGCLLALLPLFVACSTIDDDLSDCDNLKMDYELRLVTNMTTELQTVLNTQNELAVANALRTHLANIFTDYAHDVDLSFYDTKGDSLRRHHDQHIMNANEASYTLFLPKREYQHLAVANVADNSLVALGQDERCHTSMLRQTVADTIASHNTGLFTARQSMEVLDSVKQTFYVRLYMANCAAALVIDPRGHDISNVSVYTTGFAKEFNICDSIFTFADKDSYVRANRVDTGNNTLQAFCSINFPSREPDATAAPARRSVIETEEPFVSASDDHTLWKIVIFHTTADGKVVRTELGMRQPLRAGQLKVLKVYANPDGSFTTNDVSVGVSVTLDWHEGGEYNPNL